MRYPIHRSIIVFVIFFSFAAALPAQTVSSEPAPASPDERVVPLGEGDFGSMLWKTVLNLSVVVGLVCAAAFGLKRFVGRGKGGGVSSIRVLSSTMLGPKKSLFIVNVEGKRLLLGVTEGSISVLTELDAEAPESASHSRISGKDGASKPRFRDFIDAMKRRGDDE